jgi:hypothetical protein
MDEEAEEFGCEAKNQPPRVKGGKRPRPNLSTHVPVRFRPEVIEQVRIVAEHDGVTVSTWIRSVVDRAVAARLAQIAPNQTVSVRPTTLEATLQGVPEQALTA